MDLHTACELIRSKSKVTVNDIARYAYLFPNRVDVTKDEMCEIAARVSSIFGQHYADLIEANPRAATFFESNVLDGANIGSSIAYACCRGLSRINNEYSKALKVFLLQDGSKADIGYAMHNIFKEIAFYVLLQYNRDGCDFASTLNSNHGGGDFSIDIYSANYYAMIRISESF